VKTFINASAVVALVISALALSGCSRSVGWARNETRFEFGALPQAKAGEMKNLLYAQGVRVKEVPAKVVTFDVSGIESTRHLSQILDAIDTYGYENRVSVPLETAVLTFGQLQLDGSLTTTVTVRVSADAKAYVADGTDEKRAWREVPVRNGVWTGPVSTDGVVAKQGGWVYILGVRERDRRYQRINVLTKQLEKDVDAPPFADPPGTGGSVLNKVLGK